VASVAKPDLPVDIDDPYKKVSKKQKNKSSWDLTLFKITLYVYKEEFKGRI